MISRLRRLGGSTVVVGPWPGSAAAPARARRLRGYLADKWGSRSLMDCRGCRAPFAPDVEIPRDRLCSACRKDRHDAAPPLIEVEDLAPPHGGAGDG